MYDVILADPPWDHYGSPNKWAAAGKEYPLMTDEELLKFPIKDWMNDKSVLFLWATCPRLDFAVECIKSWGLEYRGVGFVWVKTKQDGTPIGAQGVRPSIVKPLTELCLCASSVKKGRPLPLGSEAVVQTVFAPRGRHSEKPAEVRTRIELLYPDSTKIELFARERVYGWDAWGLEV